jgi:multidrug efflux pump subunit AcrB/outer membrane protein TolC
MKITNFAIRHSTAVFVLIATIVIGGVRAYNSLPKEAAPDVQIPIVIVSTAYFGVSPADIETLVTNQLEQELNTLRDIDKMTSTSAESVSLITLEFDPDVDIDSALQKVREEVDSAESDLPEDAEEPEIIEINSSDWPVLMANVSGDLDAVRLQEIAEDIEEDIEKINGVLRVDLAGGVEREIQVLVDPEELRHHRVSVGQVIGAIQAENVNLPGGSLEVGDQNFTVRVPGEFERVSAMRNIVVKQDGGNPVFLKNVAEVRDDFEDRETYSRLTTWRNVEGEGADRTVTKRTITRQNISLSVLKRAGENILRIAEESKEVLREYEKRLSDAGVEIVVLNDASEMIDQQVTELENNIISGLLLVLAVLFFFMGGARNALFVAVSIPLSMLCSFLVLQALGVTLNMVVLFSLILALGMLVDNAIVVVENIYRHATEGKDRVQAAMDGTAEVGWAIAASTATTVGAFFPLLFWPGIMGEFMGYLPMTVIIVLLSSLFVALVINPTLCSVLLNVDEDEQQLDEAEVPDLWVYRVYKRGLEWSLGHRLAIVGLALGVLFASGYLLALSDPGVELFPSTTPDKFNIEVEMPDGTKLDATEDVVSKIEEPLDSRPDLVEAWVADIGTQGGGRMAGGGQAPHYANVAVDLVDVEDQPSDPDEFIEELRSIYDDIAAANISISKADMGPPTGPPISIEIIGENLKTLQSIARDVKETIRGIPGIIDIEDNLELARPEIHVLVDRAQAAMVDVDTRDIAQTVRTAVNGTEASVFREQEDEYDITVMLEKSARDDIDDIRQLTVVGEENRHIPLTELADIEVRGGTGSIHHKDQDRVVTVTAKPGDGYLAARLLTEAQDALKGMDLPTGYDIRYTGENEDRQEAADFLSGALLAAVFIIALILVTEFNSVFQPLIIILSVTLSLIGVFWTLLITGEPFGIIMTGIGIISLAGVVVNNSIVMVDYINVLRRRGYDRREAVVRGGLVRFRPVMLTAATTALGLVPIVIGVSLDFVNTRIVVGGNSVEMWGPMSRVVVVGLLVATVLTLVVVPVLYSLFDDIGQWMKRMTGFASKAGIVAGLLAGVTVGAGVIGVPSEARAQPAEEPAETWMDTAEQPEEPANGVAVDSERTLRLTEARELVRSRNFDVKLAATRVQEADGIIRQAFSMVLPSVIASGTYTVNDREVSTSFGGGQGAPPGASTEFLIQPKTDYRWNITASLRLNARALPLVQQAYTQQSLANIRVEALKDELDFAITQAYYNLLTLKRVVDISKTQLKSRKRMLEATRKRSEAGVASDYEMTRARLRVVQAEKEVERSRLQFVRVREALAQMLQTEADFDVEPPGEPLEPDSAGELVETAARERLEVDIRELTIEQAQQSVNEIYMQYLPELTTSFRLQGSKTTDLNPDAFQWQLSLNAEWVLWDGGGREAQLDQRRAQKIAAELEKEKLVTEIETDIHQAWAEYQSARAQVESGETEVELAEKALEETRRAYRHGVATQLDVINAEDQVRSAELTLARDRLQLELTIRRLRHLAGIDHIGNAAR